MRPRTQAEWADEAALRWERRFGRSAQVARLRSARHDLWVELSRPLVPVVEALNRMLTRH